MSSLVFVSYSRHNKSKAKEIHKWIQEEVGFPAFFDTSNIKVAHAWKSLIVNSLDSCFAVIILLSEKSAVSNYVTFEWSYALGKGKRIIPLVIDSQLETAKINEFLKDTQYGMEFINPTPEDWENLKQRLIELKELSDVPEEVLAASKLAKDPLPENRTAGIKLLEDYVHESALRYLRLLALDGAWDDRQIDAAIALARKTDCKDESAIEGLEKAISKGVYQKNSTSRNLLVRMGNIEAANALYRAYDSVKSHEQKDVMNSLLEFSIPETAHIFLELAKRKNVHYRLEIFDKLAKMGIDEVIPNIKEYIDEGCTQNNYQGVEKSLKILAVYNNNTSLEILCHLPSYLYQRTPPNYEFYISIISKILRNSPSEYALKILEDLLSTNENRRNQLTHWLNITIQDLRNRLKTK